MEGSPRGAQVGSGIPESLERTWMEGSPHGAQVGSGILESLGDQWERTERKESLG